MISTKQASEMGEKLILYVIGIGAFITALVDIFNAISSYSIQLEQLFTLFIYAEIIGMVGAYTSSSRIPVTLPIIIAITALCRLIVMHGKDMEALVLLGESGSILLLSGAAYVMSLKGKLSLEKKDSFENN
ncbi:phosphate-starvation-inducible PsiE family protein [Gammaproteobacteria bacterium]|jgi:protein PsiE|nr:phosphate-starvation-inducible PsiE family protein [Gammaproteobacteria bacterium]|tara:strand:- start:126 stop:518 length:393 start_codon:yes stop_codon:yes gene_type:complete